MKRRMKRLWDELELPGAAFEADRRGVLERVNGVLNAEPSGRRGYARVQIRRAVLIAAAALLLTGTTLAAVSNWDVLGAFFTGDTTSVQAYVQSPNTSVGDDQFRVTLESCVTDRQNAFLILTVKALTEEARVQLADEYFVDMGTFSIWMDWPPSEGREAASSGFWTNELKSLDPETSRTFRIQAEHLYRDATRAWMEFGFLEEGKTLDIPLSRAVGAVELTSEFFAVDRDEAPYVFTGITISPLTVQLRYRNTVSQGLLNPVYLFLMADGTLRSRNDLAEVNWSGSGYEDGICVESATFRTVQDLKEIAAVVVEGTAFPLDGGTSYPVEVPAALAPFRLRYMGGVGKNGPFLLPAEELCRKLGADYQWDGAAQRATLTYRGVTVELFPENTAMVVDGETVELEHAPVLREGQIYLDPMVIQGPWRIEARAQFVEGQNAPKECEITP